MRDGTGIDLLYVLRHDADIERAIAALVAEAIELETVAEPHQGGNVLLRRMSECRPPPPRPPPRAAAVAATRTPAAAELPAPAAAFERLGAAARWPGEVVGTAIAEARLPALGEVFRLGAVADIEGIAAAGLCLGLRVAEIGLLVWQVGLLARTILQSC